MAALDPITAAEYNNIRQSIAARVGNFTVWSQHGLATSTTTSGYGKSFSSNIVTGGSTPGVSDSVTQQQMFNLFLDIQSGYVHQFGSVNTTIVPADFSAQTDAVDFQDITDFNTMANALMAFNPATTEFPSASFNTDFLRTAGAASCSSTRTNSWGNASNVPSVITHRVTVNFGTHNNFLYFLSAGGEIRFDANLTGGTSGTSNTKDWDWARILSAMGTIRFGRKNGNWRTESISPGTGTGSLLASISTGTTPTTVIFQKQGGGVTGGTPGSVPVTSIYANNYYRIKASTNNAFATATQLIFQIELDDGDTGTGGQVESYLPGAIDEAVTGTVVSNVRTYTPSSDFIIGSTTYNAISQVPPVGTINVALQ
jgi:hypothetical protein